MVDSKYAIAYSEVLEILKHIPVEDYNKIPDTKIELFKTNSNHNYKFNYDPNKTLDEQEVSNIAKGIIILLFKNYWATEIQRNKIIAKQNYDRMKLEQEKEAKYSSDVFQNINTYNEEKSTNTKDLAIVEYKKVPFLKSFINKIKDIFCKGNHR